MYSIIIPWKAGNPQRQKNFTNVLSCLGSLLYSEYELIVVEQSEENFTSFNTLSITHIKLKGNFAFNKSWLINVAAKQAKNDDLIIWDADTLVDDDFLIRVDLELLDTRSIFVCWNKMIAYAGRDNPKERIVHSKEIRTMGGIWYTHRDFLTSLGGMNENYFGYGGEDSDLYLRACWMLQQPEIDTMDYVIRHQYHDWEYIDHSTTPTYVKILNQTRNNPSRIIHQLKKADLGNPEQPTLIKLEVK
jgi:glycosyltransferase involved in cell wall biosynthesis